MSTGLREYERRLLRFARGAKFESVSRKIRPCGETVMVLIVYGVYPPSAADVSSGMRNTWRMLGEDSWRKHSPQEYKSAQRKFFFREAQPKGGTLRNFRKHRR